MRNNKVRNVSEIVRFFRCVGMMAVCMVAGQSGIAFGEAAKRPNQPPQCFKTDSELTALRENAEQGVAQAQLVLGMEYLEGGCVPKDYEIAIKWIQEAAVQSLAGAQMELGSAYLNGRGVPKDEEKGIDWYHKAAEQGSAVAQHDLGRFYLNGIYVPKDVQQSLLWLKKAADQGWVGAMKSLSLIYKYDSSVGMDPIKATEWLRKAANAGDGIAMMDLADILLEGQPTPEVEREAVAFYQRAADQGLVGAQYKLGLCYEQGRGVLKDLEAAYVWYTISETGWHDFNERKKTLSTKLTLLQVAEAERKAKEYLQSHPPMIVE